VPSRVGGHLSARGVSDLIAREFARAGSCIRAHALRHLAATELLAATGGDIAVVAEQLGHRNIGTTAGYTKIDRRRAAAALERLQAERLHAPVPAAPTPPRTHARPGAEPPPLAIDAVPSPPPIVDAPAEVAEQIAAAKAAWATRAKTEAESQPRHRHVTDW
jgi:hypothetical protein